MVTRAGRHDLELRPHGKTHRSREVGDWMRESGIRETAVTSLRMAREFAAWGWDRITIAMPLNPQEIPELAALARSLESTLHLTVLLVDPAVAVGLSEQCGVPLSYYVELDLGYGRSGIDYRDRKAVEEIIASAGKHHWRGYYAHSGHTYEAVGEAAIRKTHQAVLERMDEVHTRSGMTRAFAYGDTPSCSTQEDFRGIHSIGPGNFVYYDLTQAAIGSCTVGDIAICLAAPVVQVKARGEVVLHAGWAQLGKDRLADGTYGRVVPLNRHGQWTGDRTIGKVSKLSQEHGSAILDGASAAEISVGDVVGILPVHACAVVNGMRANGRELILRKA
jgi:D-serine deaminase-like pyridoxal phosphate-dependent protein